jgi:hypothetical protein
MVDMFNIVLDDLRYAMLAIAAVKVGYKVGVLPPITSIVIHNPPDDVSLSPK